MKTFSRSALLSVGGAMVAVLGVSTAHAQDERARVISSQPVIQQVATPREVCRDETVMAPARTSGAGALMGGIAGGAMGNAIGGGSGRAVATAIGLFGGAVLGNHIEGRGQPQAQTVRQCSTQTVYENQTVAYDVVYEYAGRRYQTQMPHDPGRFVPIQVQPVHTAPVHRPLAVAPAPEVVHIGGFPQQRGHQPHHRHLSHGHWDRDWR